MAATYQLEIITPAAAKRLLARNSHNRPLSERTVQRYTDDLASGRWQQNGQAAVSDPQHRAERLRTLISCWQIAFANGHFEDAVALGREADRMAWELVTFTASLAEKAEIERIVAYERSLRSPAALSRPVHAVSSTCSGPEGGASAC